jgi:hypothetical protein
LITDISAFCFTEKCLTIFPPNNNLYRMSG